MPWLSISSDDFRLFKNFPIIPRIIIAFMLVISGLVIQILVPNGGIFPYERTTPAPIQFLGGLFLVIIALALFLPEKMVIVESPKFAEEGTWDDTTMKQLSDLFNLINKRKKRQKALASYFDFSEGKGKLTFSLSIIIVTVFYFLLLWAVNRLYFSTVLFLIDILVLMIPLWFIIKIEHWDPEILRKVLFYYQFSRHEDLTGIDFKASAAVELKQVIEKDLEEPLMLPTNVRFSIEFPDAPKDFDSLSIQILINKRMGSKFPSFICFLRLKKPSDWMPLKKYVATVDKIIKVEHSLEEDELHLFVLSKSPKTESPFHTSPKEAAKMFRRAYKMIQDFA